MKYENLTNDDKLLIAEVVSNMNGDEIADVLEELHEDNEPLNASMEFSRSALSSFSSRYFNEGEMTDFGSDFRIFEGVQMQRGESRYDLGVVDCGTFRVCLKI